MILLFLLSGVGAFLCAVALLGGLGPMVTLHGAWPRVALGLLGAEALCVGGLATWHYMTGSRRASAGDERHSPQQERAEPRSRRAWRLVTGLGLAIPGVGLWSVGAGVVAVDAIVLSDEGTLLFALMGILLLFFGVVALVVPDRARRRERQRIEREKAAASVPGGPRPCATCGANDLAVGVRMRVRCEGVGELYLRYEPNEEEPVVGDVCRRCGAVRIRVCTPDRDWTFG